MGVSLQQWKDGLIAEEVVDIHPELTYKDEDGTLRGVNYSQLIVPLLNEIQKLRKELDEVKNNINAN